MPILPSLTRRALLTTTLLLGASASFAQPVVPDRPLPPLPPLLPRLLVSAGSEPIQIARLAVQAQAAGSQMLTRVELTLHNPNNRLLEATFEF